ncbi:fructose-bisphosphate aldolase [Plasmodium reichenowi]|uniref:Fructose-bisphosphate aldolase n=16 Tax=Plasmodium (Laverania) TaxID=418107 RepID=ALF_PLAF7|nr:fructose-bisphosphate aldolase [Plasmodium falciparum 3D7]XP_012765492.1 fructose-bisphosphate aldolase [Plasmodium reichenowi]P14223.1 RecName: Full=Fructose-bisphosphate aldolase; Short=PfAldo; AltName: Full=41 kDa antigen [Plasmodium falciparum]Q7KQL9.1 RecName: Full=Fructose-bisphosphate aldolase [Plasmodium falciparum 3D7]2EPH_A Chain A, Fructose-bisphosphate aldolase [Plasmodium falciparum]2EPH_B Chain B, Fructose-bisphosphate aldolase [Plasmodium falciparum]2EPH_C Chain C, Fructose-|eukprot:XP_001348599.1 fructose-bisphosphate aldolase [Plasmodium falciparum 3D7]
MAHCTEYMNAPKKLPADVAEELATTAQKLVQAGKGILAADESTQTIKKRFDNIKLENTIENRASYRDLLFGTKGLGKFISGAILFEETLFQKNEAGVPMVNLLHNENIIPGIKVDKGLVNIPCTDEEKSTQGLDGLAERCKEYYKAGARFAKWRTVLVIDTAKGKPTDLSIHETAWGLARYASICQQNRLVPIVEPEILADGPHSIEVCAVVTQKVLSCVFKALQENGVLLEGALLKPNMVTAGYECTAKTTTQDVGFLTVRTLRRTVPPALPGVVFLSGGQSEEEASVNLNSINALGPHPWALTFSYGRALQASVLNTWQGKKENVAKAREVLLQRAEANSLATYGKYKGGAGGENAGASLYEKKYVY